MAEIKLISLKPSIMSERYYFELCNKMGIPTDNPNLILTEEQFSRVVHNKDFQIAKYNEKLIKLYQQQILKADKASDDVKKKIGGKYDNGVKENIKSAEADFKEKRDQITKIEEAEGRGINHELYSGFESQVISPTFLSYEISRAMSDMRDEKLNTLYQLYDSAKSQEVYSSLMREFKKKYLEYLARRIRRLQVKQSLAFLKQNKIINKNAQRYIQKRLRLFDFGRGIALGNKIIDKGINR